MSEIDSQPAIIIEGVSKSFKIPVEGSNGIKQKLINQLKGRKGYREFTPLRDISFSIKKGEFFGIVGRNGSGKSTLLKIIANIYTPEKGSVQVNGDLVPFIELGVGFNPELTGRENIYLNGALLGFSRQEVENMYDEIVNFAELHEFMEERLKNYSSGMQVRLAFSIAIRAKSDILLLDEILAVGDEAFQKKCIDYFYSIKKSGQTVILVTHDMTNVERFCDRALVLHDSKMMGIYKPSEAKKIYEQLNRPSSNQQDKEFQIEQRWGTGKAKVEKVIINNSNKTIPMVEQGRQLQITVQFEKKVEIPIIVGIGFYDETNTYVSGPNSANKKLLSSKDITYFVDKNPLNPGRYRLELAVFDEMQLEEYDHMINAINFDVISSIDDSVYGKVDLFGEWKL
jgi:ABC-2 type transport system ATP-binding protein